MSAWMRSGKPARSLGEPTAAQDSAVSAVVALLAERLPGPYEVVELERSFHVATFDYDKNVISERALAFARQQAR